MDLPVSIVTKKLPHASPSITVYYPAVVHLQNANVQSRINHAIVSALNKLLVERDFYAPSLVELLANYEIKTNERGILSLNLIVYSFTGGAHGMTTVQSLTFDTKTGKQYTLKDLFKPNSNYEQKISAIISKKIKDWNIQLLEPFKGIRSDQDFYIADTSLVIYFQLYEIAPYAWGFPYFPIPILDLQDIVQPNSPLDRMMSFT
ncbi:DUF3298 and DUF4163 domain-containing protein [Sporosarcina sp. HYO08]|uniref:DUF3298 and DUF4163 domain-containing protein n=1 Tax=Sporosarcina sp. HYO08 TaxID=1759557 RepID=UPI00079A1E93|nr:DUF3298 and DUF4163 domain-containing protein [Sporosarcina sp. HYO08]KXH87124.1 hypothetical protein AU377_00675 [Sporosarcina sp. HYO08]